MPLWAFSTSRPRVRARRNPARRLTCARSSASTSGSGRGSTAATSRANACPARTGSPSPNQHQIRERPQLAPRGQRIAARAHPGCLRLRLQLGVGQIQDRQIERLVGEPCQPFGHGLDLEDEALAGQRPDDARALDAVSERDEETLLPTARGIPEDLQRLARAICVYHRAAQLYLETPRVTSNVEGR